jgi:hypothetical protein
VFPHGYELLLSTQSLYSTTLYLLYHHKRGTHQVYARAHAACIEDVHMRVEVHINRAQGIQCVCARGVWRARAHKLLRACVCALCAKVTTRM